MTDSERRLVQRPGGLPPVGVSSGADPDEPLGRVDPAAVPPATWRQEIRGASGANLIAGMWLIISPFVLPYQSGDPWWQEVVIGVVIATLALLKLSQLPWASWLSWVNFVLGAWLVASAFWLAESNAAGWNEALTGGLVIILAAVSGAASDSAKQAAAR